MVSARLTVVPHIARISSGSSVGSLGAERRGAEDGGMDRFGASELRSSFPRRLAGCTRRATAVGVKGTEEWISPLRFLRGVTVAAGLLHEYMGALDRVCFGVSENE